MTILSNRCRLIFLQSVLVTYHQFQCLLLFFFPFFVLLLLLLYCIRFLFLSMQMTLCFFRLYLQYFFVLFCFLSLSLQLYLSRFFPCCSSSPSSFTSFAISPTHSIFSIALALSISAIFSSPPLASSHTSTNFSVPLIFCCPALPLLRLYLSPRCNLLSPSLILRHFFLIRSFGGLSFYVF